MEIINYILPLITGGVGSYLTYYLTSKSKREEAILKFKEEKYSNLLLLLQGFVGNTANSKTKKAFFEEQYKSWLYSSDDVVLSVNKMVELVIDAKGNMPNIEDGRKAVGDIVLAMRKDLLGKSTKLDYRSFRYTDVIDRG